MKSLTNRFSGGARFLFAVLALGTYLGSSARLHSESVSSPTTAVVSAANAFLASLDDSQGMREVFRYDDEKQRVRWSNLPVTFVPRSGLSLGELTESQKAAAMALLASALSERGYHKVEEIMEGDELLKIQAEKSHPSAAGAHSMFGKDLYYISIMGKPSEREAWMVQFGGHHLALNITFAGERGILTPSLTGAQPALYVENGRTVRPLGPESDKAFALLDSLDEKQRAQAILKFKVADLVLGPGHDGETIEPEGLEASSMSKEQRAMLLDLIGQWVGIAREDYARTRMEEIRAGLDKTWFAWSGSTTHEPGKSGTAYYRVQGPKVVIEFAPQPLGGDRTMHIHTMYRDPTNDYGRAVARE